MISDDSVSDDCLSNSCSLQFREFESTLLHVLDHPSLCVKSTDSRFLCAKTKLLVSEYLLQRTFDLKPSKSLLSHRPSWCESDSAHLTAVELAVDAVKLLWHLCDRRCFEDIAGSVSCSVRAWYIRLTLLMAIRFTVRLQWQLDMSLAASYYAREGAILAKGLFLHGW